MNSSRFKAPTIPAEACGTQRTTCFIPTSPHIILSEYFLRTASACASRYHRWTCALLLNRTQTSNDVCMPGMNDKNRASTSERDLPRTSACLLSIEEDGWENVDLSPPSDIHVPVSAFAPVAIKPRVVHKTAKISRPPPPLLTFPFRFNFVYGALVPTPWRNCFQD